MYVLAYTWTPEFCYDNLDDYPGCSNYRDYWTTHFTLHGLWPQYSSGGYPQDCSTEAYNSKSALAVGWNDMTKYWPEVEYAVTDPDYTGFWEHEWTKHGTCSGLAQVDYFQTTVDTIKSFGTPQSLVDAATTAINGSSSSISSGNDGSISADTLRADMGGTAYVSLQCESGAYLSGAYTCWAQEAGVPVKQIECPADVLSEDSCTASTISVPVLTTTTTTANNR